MKKQSDTEQNQKNAERYVNHFALRYFGIKGISTSNKYLLQFIRIIICKDFLLFTSYIFVREVDNFRSVFIAYFILQFLIFLLTFVLRFACFFSSLVQAHWTSHVPYPTVYSIPSIVTADRLLHGGFAVLRQWVRQLRRPLMYREKNRCF